MSDHICLCTEQNALKPPSHRLVSDKNNIQTRMIAFVEKDNYFTSYIRENSLRIARSQVQVNEESVKECSVITVVLKLLPWTTDGR